MISVVVPMRDESDNAARLLSEVHVALDGLDFELICVDDGSRDGTPVVLKALVSRYPRLRVIEHPTSLGQSAAIRTGVFAARGLLIATMDGDGQNHPGDIRTLLREMESTDATMIAGWRRERHDPWSKRVASKLANHAYRLALGDDTPDTGCGLKLFERAAFLELPYFDHMHRFIPVLMASRGKRVTSVPVRHRPRQAGRSKYGVVDRLRVGLVDLLGVRWLVARYPKRSAKQTERHLSRTSLESSNELR